MNRIEWTQTAHEDLRAIHAYIARDSKKYADGVISRIKARTRRLRAWPLSGSIVPE